MKVIFECNENMNKYKEVVSFDDDVTDEFIQAAYEDWVWEQVGEHFTWYKENER